MLRIRQSIDNALRLGKKARKRELKRFVSERSLEEWNDKSQWHE